MRRSVLFPLSGEKIMSLFSSLFAYFGYIHIDTVFKYDDKITLTLVGESSPFLDEKHIANYQYNKEEDFLEFYIRGESEPLSIPSSEVKSLLIVDHLGEIIVSEKAENEKNKL